MRRTSSRFTALALCATFTVGLTACGSGKGSDTTTPTTEAPASADAAATEAAPTEAPTTEAPTTEVATEAVVQPALAAGALRDQAGAICTQVRTAIDAVTVPETAAGASAAFTEIATLSETATNALLALPAGTADQATMASFATELKAANEALRNAASAAKSEDRAGFDAAKAAYGTHVSAFAAIAGTAGFTECAGPSSADAATSSAPAPTSPTSPASPTSTGLEVVELGSVLKPIPGQTYTPLDTTIRDQMVSGFNADASVLELAHTVGTTMIAPIGGGTDRTEQALVILIGLKRTLVGSELREFVTGVVGSGTNVAEGTVSGTRGWTYTDVSGSAAFVTVRNDTAILTLAGSPAYLETAVSGLLAANPDL